MEIRKVQVSEYRNLAKNNEYFLWSFLQREQVEGSLTIWSLFDEKISPLTKVENHLIDFLKIFPISYYESYLDESIDFLTGFGIPTELLYVVPSEQHLRWTKQRKTFYNPVIVLFKKYQILGTTFNKCYCVEGITELILEKAPELAEKFKLN